MPATPLTRTRAYTQLSWLFPQKRLALKELPSGQCAAWMDNEPRASFVGQSWEEVMAQAVREGWKSKE